MVQTNNLKQKILIITGATAVGKSSFAVEAAQRFNGEIINADSMQIYCGLNIGTGKILPHEMNGVEHHLLDIKESYEEYSVSDYVTDAKAKINDIVNRNKLPIFVGGTGFYINSLINGFNFAGSPKSDQIRSDLQKLLKEKGIDYLYDLLKEKDFAAAEKISKNDSKRIIRAIEIFLTSGETKSEKVSQIKESEYDYLLLILDDNREEIYNRINYRVDAMIKNGLVDEVKSLYEYKNCQSMQAIGYKEIIGFLDGEYDLSTAIYKIKLNSRHYAKRQLTFFRWIQAEKHWMDINKKEDIIAKISHFCDKN